MAGYSKESTEEDNVRVARGDESESERRGED